MIIKERISRTRHNFLPTFFDAQYLDLPRPLEKELLLFVVGGGEREAGANSGLLASVRHFLLLWRVGWITPYY